MKAIAGNQILTLFKSMNDLKTILSYFEVKLLYFGNILEQKNSIKGFQRRKAG